VRFFTSKLLLWYNNEVSYYIRGAKKGEQKRKRSRVPMNILLTGALGNIGSNTLQELVRQGHTVRSFDIPTQNNRKRAQQLAQHYAFDQHWGDIRNDQDVALAVQGQDVIIHLAFIIPPAVDENPQLARAVNVDGTQNIVKAAQALSPRPKLLIASTLDVFGHTQKLPPPRTINDPVTATDTYSEHKLFCEAAVKASGLSWAIYRFADVPPLAARRPHPIMFKIPLDTRIEMLHTHDAGLAIANGINSEIWGKTWLIGGGKTCQVYYRDYLQRSLQLAGIGDLPPTAFSSEEYCTDWLDTDASQALLHYQRHNFDSIMADVAKYNMPPAPLRPFMPLVAPLIRQQILKMSPYYKKAT
jgi:nucleoside-diphosphate-sugar epimerase